jgi:CheY-like chemotaxis protein
VAAISRTNRSHLVCGTVGTEAAAVSEAARLKPDLMLVDARLDGGSGISAVDRICIAGFVPHVFVTGDVNSVKANRPQATILQKPFNEKRLEQAIARALRLGAVH